MNYALSVCKIFGPKIRVCKLFDKSYLWKGRTAFSRALLGKMLTGKRLFFMLYNLLGFTEGRCNQWASWPRGDILRIFKRSMTFPQKTEYHRKVVKNFHKRVEFAIDLASNDLSLH